MISSAREVPELRAEMLQWARDPSRDGFANWLGIMVRPETFEAAGYTLEWYVERFAMRLRAADLYCVSKDMTYLARHSASKLDNDVVLLPDEVPSDFGFMVYLETPLVGEQYTEVTGKGFGLVTWSVIGDRVFLDFFAPNGPGLTIGAQYGPALDAAVDSTQSGGDAVDVLQAISNALPEYARNRRAPIHIRPACGYTFTRQLEFTFGEPLFNDLNMAGGLDLPTWTNEKRELEALKVVVATWLLMGQNIVRVSHVDPDRKAQKRISRIEDELRTLNSVRYADLRKVSYPEREVADEPGTRNYQVRWIQSGHWRTLRSDFYKEKRGQKVWVSEHIRGPEGAPLVVGPKVNMLRR
ncbi:MULTISPECIES: hypothetical protein [Streptomyces]|uniref:hypothetical protein n=1 Tax=Streptomyces TaxID=1883 RepID=UPI003648C304